MSTGEAAPLLVIVGPTGSGKSELALDLAQALEGELVNCDSVQIYRGFDIGSAKTPTAERRNIPHHLLDVAAPTETFTAGDYQRLGRAALRDISGRGRLPIVVGGTGFYLRALLEGLFSGPGRDEDLRERLQRRAERRPDSLHRLLQRFDPNAGRAIHPNDHQKLIRALEVCLLARQPITTLQQEAETTPLTGYRICQIGLAPARAELRSRLDARTAELFRKGLIEEAAALHDAGVPWTAKPFESVGYVQAVRVLQQQMTIDEAIADTQVRTRQYAKRQMTWFRRDSTITWIEGFGSALTVKKTALAIARNFLQK